MHLQGTLLKKGASAIISQNKNSVSVDVIFIETILFSSTLSLKGVYVGKRYKFLS